MPEQPFTPNLAQDISAAATAGRARLEAVLAGLSLTFEHWVALTTMWNATVAHAGPLEPRAALLDTLQARLGPDRPAAVLADLESVDLARDLGDTPPGVELTPAGEEMFRRIRDAIERITAEQFAGIPAEDVETTRRVLRLLTERARAATVA